MHTGAFCEEARSTQLGQMSSMNRHEVKLTREQLYESVWTRPTTHLAREFGISDVALAKICKKLDVPKPPPGYWRAVEFGRRPAKPPLPELRKGVPAYVDIRPSANWLNNKALDPAALERIRTIADPGDRVSVARTLRNPHPLVESTRLALSQGSVDGCGRLHAREGAQCLSVRVSKSSLHRALLIMDAVLKSLEARGFSIEIEIGKQGSRTTRVVVEGERVNIYLWERADRSDCRPDSDRADAWRPWQQRWEYSPSGKLTFVVDEHVCDDVQKRWTDGKRNTLEEQLNGALAGILTIAELKRVRSLEQAAEEQRRIEAVRRREVAERKRAEEQSRINSLELAADAWFKSQSLRAFLDDFEKAVESETLPVNDGQSAVRWLEWARRHADRIDPLANGDVGSLIRGRTAKKEDS